MLKGTAAGAAAARPDAKADAAQLAARADAFRGWGNRDDALALYDASVLLDPAAAPRADGDAMMVAATLAHELRYGNPLRDLVPPSCDGSLRVVRVADYDHARTQPLSRRVPPPGEFKLKLASRALPEANEANLVELRHDREVILRVIQSKVAAGVYDATLEYCVSWIPWRVGHDEAARDACVLAERVALAVKDHPKARSLVEVLLRSTSTRRRGVSGDAAKVDYAEYRAELARLLDRLAAAPDAPAVREAALRVKASFAAAATRPRVAATPRTLPPDPATVAQEPLQAGPVDVSFRKLPLEVVLRDGSLGALVLSRWIGSPAPATSI